MRYLKNQFRGRIGRTILVKKRRKSSPFYFSTPLKPSVYAVFDPCQSCCNRETWIFRQKRPKNSLVLFLKGR